MNVKWFIVLLVIILIIMLYVFWELVSLIDSYYNDLLKLGYKVINSDNKLDCDVKRELDDLDIQDEWKDDSDLF